jgi:hypothetical protein
MRVSRMLLAAAACTLLAACHMRPTPLSVQAGSTFAVMLDATSEIGYGAGDTCNLQSDKQRGRLVWTLDYPAGHQDAIALTTRLTTSVIAPTAATQGITPPPRAIVALVDVPSATPPGTHSLHVSQSPCPGLGSATLAGLTIPYPSVVLKVLPESIEVGAETIEGAPFELEADAISGVAEYDISTLYRGSVPAPSVELRLSAPVWSAELRLTYPEDQIELVDAVAWDPNNLFTEHRPQTAILRRTARGEAVVSAVAREAAFPVISLVFELQGAAAFDPNVECSTNCSVDCVGLRICSKDFRDSAGAPLTTVGVTKVIR